MPAYSKIYIYSNGGNTYTLEGQSVSHQTPIAPTKATAAKDSCVVLHVVHKCMCMDRYPVVSHKNRYSAVFQRLFRHSTLFLFCKQHCVWDLQKRKLNTWNWLHRWRNSYSGTEGGREPGDKQKGKTITSSNLQEGGAWLACSKQERAETRGSELWADRLAVRSTAPQVSCGSSLWAPHRQEPADEGTCNATRVGGLSCDVGGTRGGFAGANRPRTSTHICRNTWLFFTVHKILVCECVLIYLTSALVMDSLLPVFFLL